jgi:hypothetical protein
MDRLLCVFPICYVQLRRKAIPPTATATGFARCRRCQASTHHTHCCCVCAVCLNGFTSLFSLQLLLRVAAHLLQATMQSNLTFVNKAAAFFSSLLGPCTLQYVSVAHPCRFLLFARIKCLYGAVSQ